jgi:oligoendopeptidase F
MNTEILTRSQIPTTQTWDLSDLFRDFDHWEQELSKLPAPSALESTLIEKFKGKLKLNSQTLYDCLQFRDNLFRKLENLMVYAHLRQTEDVEDQISNEKCGKIDNLMAALSSQFAFIEPEILTIPNLTEWISSEPLNTYSFFLKEILRKKSRILSEKEENLLARLSVPLNLYDNIHSKWNNADLQFNPAKDSHGKEHLVSNSRYSLNMESPDRTLRQNTFQSYYSEIIKWRNTITENYYGNMIGQSTIAQIRGFEGALEASLFDDDIPVSLYDNLIATVRKNLSSLHKSMTLRKKILNISAVEPFDRGVSLYTQPQEPKFSWEEGCALVLAAIKPLGEEYVSIAKKGLTIDRWVDRAENKGKRSGAFSWGTYDSRPYMMQSWTGTLGDIFTLAHELGHSMHSFYSHKNQPYHTANYTIFVAEVASTLNESLLADYILNQHGDESLSKMVVSQMIENFEGTVLRQVLFATFEREAARIADCGDVFTPQNLEDFYFGLNTEWYGKDSLISPLSRVEWMRIPHFYSPFYVYKYATSYCASLSLAEKLKINLNAGQDSIFKLLKAGGSKPSLDILKSSGVDLTTSTPIENAFSNYEQNIVRAQKLFLGE